MNSKLNHQQCVRLYQWTVGLDELSDPKHLEAAARDAVERGAVFALRGGASNYRKWLKHQCKHVDRFHLTLATASDDWWWVEGLDRIWGLELLDMGAIAATPAGTPEPAPVGLDYSDLLRGLLRQAGRPITRRLDERASGVGRCVADH